MLIGANHRVFNNSGRWSRWSCWCCFGWRSRSVFNWWSWLVLVLTAIGADYATSFWTTASAAAARAATTADAAAT